MQENLPLVGTPAFASLNSHRGLQLGRRDDIESLVYSLMFLHRGSLPWLTADGKSPPLSATFRHKQTFLAVRGADDIPIAFVNMLNHARDLAFTQKPDYSQLRTILESVTDSTEVTLGLLPYTPNPMPDTSTPNIIVTPGSRTKSKTVEGTPRQW